MFKLMDKKIITILRKFCVLNWPYESSRCQNNLFTFNYCKLQNKSVISVKSMFCQFFFNDLLVLHSASESQRPQKLVIGIKN